MDTAGAATLGELALRTFNFATDVAEFLRLLVDAVQPKLAVVDSGTYAPVLTLTENADSSSVSICHWMRIGDVVAVSGALTVNATAAAVMRVQMTLPLPSVVSAASSVAGTGADIESNPPAVIRGDTASNSAEFGWVASATSDRTFYFSYCYRIEGV